MESDGIVKILVIDDDKDVLYTARLVLRGLFEKVDVLDSPDLIPQYLKKCKYDVIVLDMNFSRGHTSGKEGIVWLDKILKIDPEVMILMTTAYGEIDLAVQAMKMGATDFIIKPWNKSQLVTAAAHALRIRNSGIKQIKSEGLKQVIGKGCNYPEIISQSPVMSKVLETISTVAQTDASILIMGESGTGKELVARSLHQGSLRKNESFIHVDLGALPETLFEAELFGHTRGAFTDAKEEREGRFEAASKGTLFLDEIGNLTLPLQAKILTAIQNREVVRLGSNKPIHVNIRLVSATNMPLYEMAESFQFRQDLLYRINTVEITIPPLRERREDIPQLVDYYLKIFRKDYQKPGINISGHAIQKLVDYHWPGNIRELAHCIERSVILNKNGIIGPDDFDLKNRKQQTIATVESLTKVEDYEKIAITKALDKHSRNLSKTAEELGIARSTLYRKITYFGIGN